jgi:hypothetical protein
VNYGVNEIRRSQVRQLEIARLIGPRGRSGSQQVGDPFG